MPKPMIQFDDFSKPAKIMALLYGYGGGGKSFTAYQLAADIAGDSEFPIIDAEYGSSKKYLAQFPNMRPIILEEFSHSSYLAAIDLALTLKPKVIVVDGLSPEWNGTGGVLDQAGILEAQRSSSINVWQTPKANHAKLINRLDSLPVHIIATVRAKDKVIPEKDPATGKVEMKKLPASIIQDKELNFPFDLMILSERSGKKQTVKKSRLHGFLAEGSILKEGAIEGRRLSEILSDWLASQQRG